MMDTPANGGEHIGELSPFRGTNLQCLRHIAVKALFSPIILLVFRESSLTGAQTSTSSASLRRRRS